MSTTYSDVRREMSGVLRTQVFCDVNAMWRIKIYISRSFEGGDVFVFKGWVASSGVCQILKVKALLLDACFLPATERNNSEEPNQHERREKHHIFIFLILSSMYNVRRMGQPAEIPTAVLPVRQQIAVTVCKTDVSFSKYIQNFNL